MPFTYEDARGTAYGAAQVNAPELILPTYTGAGTDPAYLHDYVLGIVTDLYGVDASVFDHATVYSTSILRDFVHRAGAAVRRASPVFRIVRCGAAVAWALPRSLRRNHASALRRYESFGYETNFVAEANGDIGPFPTFDPAHPENVTYDDSHGTTTVYVEDLDKWVVQDGTFNFAFRDGEGNILSWYEARELRYSPGYVDGDLIFDTFHNYRGYQFDGVYV